MPQTPACSRLSTEHGILQNPTKRLQQKQKRTVDGDKVAFIPQCALYNPGAQPVRGSQTCKSNHMCENNNNWNNDYM